MNKGQWKRFALAALLITLLLSATGCFVKPDPTVDDRDTNPVSVLPFPTATEIPTLPPSGGGDGFDSWATNPPVNIVTQAPAPTIQIITPSPTPFQVFTPPPATPVTITPRPATGTPKPQATNTAGSLRLGAEGQNVRNLQARLKELGYYTGSVDGSFGPATDTALKAFQKANGLSADGVAGTRTMEALDSRNAAKKSSSSTGSKYATSRPTPKTYVAPTLGTYRYLQVGSSGTAVTNLQRRLKTLGYYNGTVNGRFDEATKAAVEAFQKRNGLWVDGVAGEETQSALYSNSALPYGGAVQPVTTTQTARALTNGMNGEDVRQLQARLQDLYYYSGAVNGSFETATELAVKTFQQRNGILSDGVAGPGTLLKLYSFDAVPAPTTQPAQAIQASSETLQLGSVGEDVTRLQERLYDLGYYSGLIDGIYSEPIKVAITNFQNANNLTADGKAGKSTQQKLYSASAKPVDGLDDAFTTLREGDAGERVRALQTLLSTYGYFTEEIDGLYGGRTVTAIAQFQTRNGLSVDGVAGPATLQALYQGNPIYADRQDFGEAPPAMQFATLRQGMSGPDIMVMQQYLMEYGYYMDELHGKFDNETLIAVQAFQADNGLTTDGVAGQATLELLYSGNANVVDGYTAIPQPGAAIVETPSRSLMRQGDDGQDVYNLQERLQILGYFDKEPSGYYDAATRDAVRAFQQRNQLKVDGEAGIATVNAMYAINVTIASGSNDWGVEPVSNRVRELEEQSAGGAIQASLSGGGLAASYQSSVYFSGGKNGSLYVRNANGVEKQLYESPARFIHASDKGVVFVSGSKILRIPAGGGATETLASVGGVSKLSMIGDTMIYQEGSSLVRNSVRGDAVSLADGINDFTIDVFQYEAYVATDRGIRSIALNGNGDTLLLSSRADQVQLCDSALFFRSGGEIYRLENGISVLLMDADATWMGIYRDKLYYISGDRLYRSDTLGQNGEIFYDGQTAEVSFVSGKAYITQSPGGPVREILAVE